MTKVLDARELGDVPRQLPDPEVAVLLFNHPNILIEGRDVSVAATVVALTPEFYGDVYVWPDTPEQLPPSKKATLVVPEVGQLTGAALQVLHTCMERTNGQLQVVTTSTMRLSDRVTAGTFPANLYYRLNYVLLRLD